MTKQSGLVGGVALASLAMIGCPGPTNTPADAFAIDAVTARDAVSVEDAASGEDATTADAARADTGLDASMLPGTDAYAPWPTDPCEQITRVRALSGGTLPTARPVTGAVVSYVLATQPAGASDPVGFFVQCPGTAGPALFVTVDPATLTPIPAVGDVVSFDVVAALDVASGTGSTGDQHRVSEISGYSRMDTGASVTAQDVSTIDLTTMIDAHESELVTAMGTIASAAVAGGAGYTSFQITTTGVPTAGPNLRLRLPLSVASALVPGPAIGCAVSVGPTPLWRFTTAAQLSAWTADDLVLTCTTPTPAAGEVFVTEVGARFTDADLGKQFVELHNPSATVTYDLGGCVLADAAGPTDPAALTLPAGTYLAPGGYLVVAGAASEITGALALPEALTFDGDDTVSLHCEGALVDQVSWSEDALGFEANVSAQLDIAQIGAGGAGANDDASHWCATPSGHDYGTARRGTPGAANVSCTPTPSCTALTHLVINEIDYDQPGSDTAEFVELYNPTGADVPLAGYVLVAVNGTTAAGAEYARVALTGTLAAGGYLLVTASGSSVPGATLSFGMALQNGAPDGVLLLGPDGAVVDTAIYEGTMPTVTLMGSRVVTLTEAGSIGADNGVADGLSRRPNGCDRDMPTMDWGLAALTPGAPNL